ncbi:hypothetical protein TREMEDRAFT_56176 [Tremella mesenterica DSM 1558]|uniref:uncharacterized protein n=1 Tax=Tremella mesenterica (strain ATCC 24925 / CBS 8224 / DSM 1558 / NBRC 9311 / NRRL Y-6157 / RJB 2259-6 / UBC 559-6) TaxID=578456 RepID=UPI0003F49478|nr:uncharacterized protein TREMEDRAFT_56176 [Tremella mesenterica DSM 1558]EIW73307.1 hypothetical protein TREMEDRAFT_56176 [Tremella mesenterica DSM 1558]
MTDETTAKPPLNLLLGSQSLKEVDQGLLDSIVLTNRLKRTPDVVICSAEAAGGHCANSNCSDIHLSRSQPSEDDLVDYVMERRPKIPSTRVRAAIKAVKGHEELLTLNGSSPLKVEELLSKVGDLLDIP